MTTHADIAAEVPEHPQPLAYAGAATSGPMLSDLQPALAWLLGVAILSGLCVGSCFLLMANPVLGGVLHLAVYGAILFLAVRGSVALVKAGFGRAGWLTLDSVAGLGLVMIGLTPVGLWTYPADAFDRHTGALLLAAAFAMLSFTSVRHWDFYRKLSYPVQTAGYSKTAGLLRALGMAKAVYETLWLLCCTVPLIAVSSAFRVRPADEDFLMYVAFAAFFGCLGYAVVWVAMIVMHARVLRLSRIRAASGFEVVMPQPVIG